jgi:hypothetical protein
MVAKLVDNGAVNDGRGSWLFGENKINDVTLDYLTDEQFEEELAKVIAWNEQRIAQEKEQKEKEEAERKEQERIAEENRLKQEELEKQQREIEEQKRKIEEEKAAIEKEKREAAEKKRQERHNRLTGIGFKFNGEIYGYHPIVIETDILDLSDEDFDKQFIQHAGELHEAIQREEHEKQLLEERRIEEEKKAEQERLKQEEEKRKADKERAERLAPDIHKLNVYIKEISGIKIPAMETEEGVTMKGVISEKLSAFLQHVTELIQRQM